MKNVKRSGRRKRTRKCVGQYKRSMLAVSAVLVLLMVVVSVNGMTLRAKEKEYQAQETELEQQIEDEKARASEIDDLESYVGTDEYVEEVAKDKLGLVYEDEIILKGK